MSKRTFAVDDAARLTERLTTTEAREAALERELRSAASESEHHIAVLRSDVARVTGLLEDGTCRVCSRHPSRRCTLPSFTCYLADV